MPGPPRQKQSVGPAPEIREKAGSGMDNFYTPEEIWPDGPYPHFLVLFDRHPEYHAYAEAHREVLDRYRAELGIVPKQWLHCTIQGIHHTVTPGQREQLRAAAREALQGMRPITVQLGPTWPGVHGITTAFYPEAGMAELHRRVRSAVLSVPGITTRPPLPRFWPHSSLAYARQDFDDRRLNRELLMLRPERVKITIDSVALVDQRLDLEAGYCVWDVVEEFRFSGPA